MEGHHRQRNYICVCKDAYDGAVCLRIYRSRKMEAILDSRSVGECWTRTRLRLPAQVQFDTVRAARTGGTPVRDGNAREVVGWGPAARYLSRVLRLCLRFGVEPVLVPPAQPQRQGSVENFNGWFQPRLFQRRYARLSALKRELHRLETTGNVHGKAVSSAA